MTRREKKKKRKEKEEEKYNGVGVKLLSKSIDKQGWRQLLPKNKNQHVKNKKGPRKLYNLSKNNGDGLFAHQFFGSRVENQNKFASQFLTREGEENKSILPKVSFFKKKKESFKKEEEKKEKERDGKNEENEENEEKERKREKEKNEENQKKKKDTSYQKYLDFSRISKAKRTQDQKPVLKFDQPLFLKGKEREYKLLHEELSHKKVTNSFLLKESTTTPFHPCWNKGLGRVVISNKLLSEKFANRLLYLSKIKGVERVVFFKEKKSNKKQKEPTYLRGKRIVEEENKRDKDWFKSQSAHLKNFKEKKNTLIKFTQKTLEKRFENETFFEKPLPFKLDECRDLFNKDEKKVANKKNNKKERLNNSVKKYGPKFLKVARAIGLFILVVYLIPTEPEEKPQTQEENKTSVQSDSLVDSKEKLDIARETQSKELLNVKERTQKEENQENKASVQSDNLVDSKDTEEKERIIKKCNQYYLKQKAILEDTSKAYEKVKSGLWRTVSTQQTIQPTRVIDFLRTEAEMRDYQVNNFPKWLKMGALQIGEDPDCLSRDEIEKWEVKVQDITGSEEEPLIIDIARKKTPSRNERFIEENEKNKASVQSDNPVDSRDTEEKERIIKKCNQYYLKQKEGFEKTTRQLQKTIKDVTRPAIEANQVGQMSTSQYTAVRELTNEIWMAEYQIKSFPKWLKGNALNIGEDPDCLSRDEIEKWKVKLQDITASKEEPLILDIARRKTQSENLEENKKKEDLLNLQKKG